MNRIFRNFDDKSLNEIDKTKIVTEAAAELEEIYRILNKEKPVFTVDIQATDGSVTLEI